SPGQGPLFGRCGTAADAPGGRDALAGAISALERTALVLDAHPVVVFLNQESGADLIEALLERAAHGRIQLAMSVVNVAEVLAVQERRGGAEASHRTLDLLQDLPVNFAEVDLELASRA